MKMVDTTIQQMNGLQVAMVASALVIRDRFLEVKAMNVMSVDGCRSAIFHIFQ
jgi:hypothetical protein